MDHRGWSRRLKVCLPRWRSHASRPPAPPPCCTPTDHSHCPPSGNPRQLDHIPVPFHRGHGPVKLNNCFWRGAGGAPAAGTGSGPRLRLGEDGVVPAIIVAVVVIVNDDIVVSSSQSSSFALRRPRLYRNNRQLPVQNASACARFRAPHLPSSRLVIPSPCVHQISTICWDHYEGGDEHCQCRRCHRHSLYVCSLGPCAYVWYRLVRSPSPVSNGAALVGTAMEDPDNAAARLPSTLSLGCIPMHLASRGSPITLIKGERVGALVLSSVIRPALGDIAESSCAKDKLLDAGA